MNYDNEEFIEMVAAAVKRNMGAYGNISCFGYYCTRLVMKVLMARAKKLDTITFFGLKYREGRVKC